MGSRGGRRVPGELKAYGFSTMNAPGARSSCRSSCGMDSSFFSGTSGALYQRFQSQKSQFKKQFKTATAASGRIFFKE